MVEQVKLNHVTTDNRGFVLRSYRTIKYHHNNQSGKEANFLESNTNSNWQPQHIVTKCPQFVESYLQQVPLPLSCYFFLVSEHVCPFLSKSSSWLLTPA